ncbi:TrkA C-terminal domain-containing protein [Halalkalibacter kiskunsagensis]|uniref:TrkA C-terminal domain-containing protein n=1 Tax=Halalkalibacter kiskunsagensis TaxID=1548599 RepID=A0ABV6KBI8_9BACI
MKMNITDLPGVGKKISFVNAENQMMAIIIHHTGKRELYFFEDVDDDEAIFSFNLSSEDTKQLAAQLLGASFSPIDSEKLEKIKIARKQIVVEWIDITKQSKVAGLNVSVLKAKMPSDASLIGIFRNDEFLVDLKQNLLIEIKDTIMVVGKKDSINEIEMLCEGKGR